ncbi:hypothetical protein PPROV_000405700 [Pycnococcus provasolii]|uniref:Mitochondrial import inner membrane translocase subunit TIM22 n=1 Tax=Pycnococcus provasolii TaxID=41880 RepID=A0A830HE57_9CHLO|nr:hypothetical protein PPROV_000405700 [Pycnococcus provasolii]
MATTSEKSKSTASASPPWTSLMHATAAGTALGASTGLAAGLAGASADWLTKRKRPTLRVLRPARTTGALAFTYTAALCVAQKTRRRVGATNHAIAGCATGVVFALTDVAAQRPSVASVALLATMCGTVAYAMASLRR